MKIDWRIVFLVGLLCLQLTAVVSSLLEARGQLWTAFRIAFVVIQSLTIAATFGLIYIRRKERNET